MFANQLSAYYGEVFTALCVAIGVIMPYSGLQGFSYPSFFGLLSILFSFGKGLIFFVPGLLLPVRGLLRKAALEWRF